MTPIHYPLIPKPVNVSTSPGFIWVGPETMVRLVHSSRGKPESYSLRVDGDGIVITASSHQGWVRAMATLAQILPTIAFYQSPKVKFLNLKPDSNQTLPLSRICAFMRPHKSAGVWNSDKPDNTGPWSVLCSPLKSRPSLDLEATPLWKLHHVTIEDSPVLAWRGLLLDCARHFFPLDFIFRVLDHLCFCKLNVFHWHLCDDQGFRIPIDSFPRLHQAAAFRGKEAFTYGGSYSKDDIAQVLAYAAERGITVVPEIDVPGHAGAFLAAYPHLGCSGKPQEVPQNWGVLSNFICPGKESSFEFLVALFSDLAKLFPGSPIHLGGDEVRDLSVWDNCPHCMARRKEKGLADSRALEGWFMRRLVEHCAGLGLDLIVWDDCARHFTGPASPTSPLLQVWHHAEDARQAARLGNRLLISQADYYYLDMFYHPPMPKYWIEPLSSKKSWSFDPWTAFPEGFTGMEAALWTEYCPSPADAEWKLLPRLLVLAEKAWAGHQGSWEDYRSRLRTLSPWFDVNGVRYYREPCVFLPENGQNI